MLILRDTTTLGVVVKYFGYMKLWVLEGLHSAYVQLIRVDKPSATAEPQDLQTPPRTQNTILIQVRLHHSRSDNRSVGVRIV